MAHYITLGIIIIGCILGWILFFYTMFHIIFSRKQEIKIIQEITRELDRIKEELKQLK